MTVIIGVDIGGTFTDCVVVGADGTTSVSKAFSTPGDFSEGVVNALRAQDQPIEELLGSSSLFLHATSIAENAIVDTTLAPAGLIVTGGFEDTLAMTRGGYGRWSGLTEDEKKDVVGGRKPRPIVPRTRIAGLHERVDAAGKVVAPVDVAEVEAAVRALESAGARSVGVCLLWSFRNPENERTVDGVLERLRPGWFRTLSSELSPTEGEYERVSTVALNVALGPVAQQYLDRLQGRLRAYGYTGPILVMQAHGGLLAIDEAAARAVGLIESGPVAGLIGCATVGERCGFPKILAADMGGTTFKVGVVRDGRVDVEREPSALRYHYSVPKMEIVSIGMAGGSVVSLDPVSALPKVGPRSAGALPGPVCYGFGGTEPTITDVDAVLGYLDSRFFLGGRATLNVEAAREALADHIAAPLGMDVLEAATAVQRLANSMMFDLLHKQTVEKGLDPSEYVLLSYGGSAGMHMTAVAPELGVREVVVPKSASVQSAFGLVNADIVDSESVTCAIPVRSDAAAAINGLFAEMQGRLERRAIRQGRPVDAMTFERNAGIRYKRQLHAVSVSLPGAGPLDGAGLDRVIQQFDALYAERYGPDAGYRAAGTEVVSLQVRGIVKLARPRLQELEAAGPAPDHAAVESRSAYFLGGMREAPCYDFALLCPGNIVHGPAIVWSPITTAVVHPGQRLRCDLFMNMIVDWGSG